jgi:photosystem II stability/assembly factor-like uncharacterized protein
MPFPALSPRLLTGAAALACAAALMPMTSLVATASPAAAAAATGPPAVPAGFQPASASFVSPASGYVLGAVGCTLGHVCSARLVSTTDGGARWHFANAPDVALFNSAGNLLTQASRVSGVMFASRPDGWLYGPGLYATHDGGAHWRRISLGGNIMASLGGGVVAMAASSGTAYAVISPDPFNGAPEELYSSPVGTNAWARVGTMTGGPGASLAVSGKAAWFGTGSSLWATADGMHWRKYPFSCPAGLGLEGIAAASSSQVAFLCARGQGTYHTVKEVLRSVNGGRTEYLTGQAPLAGDVYGFAVPPYRATVITIAVVTPGLSYLYRSANGGKTWAEIAVSGTSGGVSLSSLSYLSPTAGWVVAGQPGFPGPGRLLRTSDAGRTWDAVRF